MQDPSADLQLKPVARRRAYQEVVAQIQEEILAGRLRSGDRLPGERDLAEMLEVSRSSVREALRVLETLHIVRARTGTGPESGSIIVNEAGAAMGGVLLMHAALEHFSLDEVVEVRIALEAATVRSAAVHREDDQLAQMEDLVAQMESGAHEPHEFLGFDTSFHLLVAKASGNRLMAYVMQLLREIIEHWLGRLFEHNTDWPKLRSDLAAEHRAILEAIRGLDGDAGERIVEEHIRMAYERAQG